jgi:hypothetical protein
MRIQVQLPVWCGGEGAVRQDSRMLHCFVRLGMRSRLLRIQVQLPVSTKLFINLNSNTHYLPSDWKQTYLH